MDSESRLRGIKTQRHFNDMRPVLCRTCGARIPDYFEADPEGFDDFHAQVFCSTCLIRAIKSQGPVREQKEPRPVCGYCFKRRKLIGKWCRTCQRNHQRREISKLLEKELLNENETMALNFFKRQAIWGKEFGKGRVNV